MRKCGAEKWRIKLKIGHHRDDSFFDARARPLRILYLEILPLAREVVDICPSESRLRLKGQGPCKILGHITWTEIMCVCPSIHR